MAPILLPPSADGPPPSKREVWGVRRSRPTALPSIGYRGFAVAPMTLRAPSRSLLYNPGCRVATLLVSKGVMGFLGDLRGRNSKSPPNPLGLAERVPRPQAVEGVLGRQKEFVHRQKAFNPIFAPKDCKKTSGLLYYNIRSGLPSAVPAPHPLSERTWQREKAHPLIFGHPRRVRPDFC